jgi:hypothetical protein
MKQRISFELEYDDHHIKGAFRDHRPIQPPEGPFMRIHHLLAASAAALLAATSAQVASAEARKPVALRFASTQGDTQKTAELSRLGHVMRPSTAASAPSFEGARCAFVLFLSQGLSLELLPKGVYVQAVLPAGTRTEIWERAGIDINALPELMEVGELVDAALVGFDRRELVTIPPLHDAARWDALDAARQGLLSEIRQSQVAQRYQTAS